MLQWTEFLFHCMLHTSTKCLIVQGKSYCLLFQMLRTSGSSLILEGKIQGTWHLLGSADRACSIAERLYYSLISLSVHKPKCHCWWSHSCHRVSRATTGACHSEAGVWWTAAATGRWRPNQAVLPDNPTWEWALRGSPTAAEDVHCLNRLVGTPELSHRRALPRAWSIIRVQRGANATSSEKAWIINIYIREECLVASDTWDSINSWSTTDSYTLTKDFLLLAVQADRSYQDVKQNLIGLPHCTKID